MAGYDLAFSVTLLVTTGVSGMKVGGLNRKAHCMEMLGRNQFGNVNLHEKDLHLFSIFGNLV